MHACVGLTTGDDDANRGVRSPKDEVDWVFVAGYGVLYRYEYHKTEDRALREIPLKRRRHFCWAARARLSNMNMLTKPS